MTLERALECSIVIAGIKKDLAAGKAANKELLKRIVEECGGQETAGILAMPASQPAEKSLGSRGLPADLYYTGSEFAVPLPPLKPIDETRPLTGLDRDARALAAEGRAGLIRFFAGRWSQRLGRVVRP
jgi:hypothetical protein